MAVLLVALLAVSWYVRALGVYSQVNQWAHPDENRMVTAVHEVDMPDWGAVFAARDYSSFAAAMEPMNPKFFAYGSFTIYLYFFTSEWSLNVARQIRNNYKDPTFSEANFLYRPFLRAAFLVSNAMKDYVNSGRTWSVIFGVLTVLLTYFMARRLLRREWAYLAAVLFGLNVLHLQLSRFLTSDVILVFWMMLCLYSNMLLARNGRLRHYLLGGLFIGVSFATKLNGIIMFGPFLLAHGLHLLRKREVRFHDYVLGAILVGVTARSAFPAVMELRLPGQLTGILVLLPFALGLALRYLPKSLPISRYSLLRWGMVSVAGVVTAATFLLIEPFAVLDNFEFQRQIREESGKVSGFGFPPPYMIQFFETPRFLFQLEHLVTWGFGIPTGLIVVLGVVFGVAMTFRRYSPERVLLVTWTLLYYLAVGNLFVKWMRHMLPVYPTLCILGVLMCADLFGDTRWRDLLARKWRWPAYTGAGLALVMLGWTSIWAVAFLDLYRKPNTRHKASVWIYENVPAGSKVLTEHWDEGLPNAVRGMPGKHPGIYKSQQMRNYEPQTPPLMQETINQMVESEYIFLNTKRLYHSVSRDPRSTHRRHFYRLLFAGKFGYELVKSITSYPTIFGFEFVDDLAEESFSVYDHPKALVFKKVREVSAEEMRQLWNNPPLEVIEEWTIPRMLTAREGGGSTTWGLGGLSFAVLTKKRQEEETSYKRNQIADTVKREEPTGKRSAFDGGMGEFPGQFNQPRGLTKAADGTLFVCDFHNHRVQKFSRTGEPLLSWGKQGEEKFGEFKDPHGVALDAEGNVLVIDTWNQRIQRFTPEGKFIDATGQDVSLFAPTDADFDAEGNIFVSDTGNGRVVKLSSKLRAISEFGSRGTGDQEFQEPKGIAVDRANGLVYVADHQNNRVQVWRTNMEHVANWPLPPTPNGDKPLPTYVLLGADGSLFVGDLQSRNIYRFSKDGTLLARLPEARLVDQPMDMVLDGDSLIVVEHGANRLNRVPLSLFVPLNPAPADADTAAPAEGEATQE